MTNQYRSSSHPTDEAAQSPMPESKAPEMAPIPSPSPDSEGREPNSPLPCLGEGLGERASSPETAPAIALPNPSPDANYDYVHHILIGSPQGVIDAINRLHLGRRIERHRWTPLMPVRETGIHITPAQGQVISYLIEQRAV